MGLRSDDDADSVLHWRQPMPASRSRTERWRECLDQILQRQGGLELTLPVDQAGVDGGPGTGGKNLLWRVRLLRIS